MKTDQKQPAHRSQLRGRDKFADVEHPWMPKALPTWTVAMASVNRSGPQKASHELWGYWVPEPAILVGPKDDSRLKTFFWNWLRVRPAWLYLLAHPLSTATTAKPQWWRDLLGGHLFDTSSAPYQPSPSAKDTK